ncbi:hypothetical protein BEH_17465 [Priestia filamentosa]|uniref:O-antigen ligase-related domain-containing protein n=1 Tax=Priestia filamentosa TaxID=1402861 RepID=A0A0H4KN17_9BACI|nr:O-antigen ligase family protein [Priestia filamentosa]AKO93704.1 hypothetical protein BEH_17465 [Priestia filamentosa]
MGEIEIYNRNSRIPTFLIFLAITVSSYNIDIGFSLKPYMIVITLLTILRFSNLRFYRLTSFETLMFVFYIYYCSTGLLAKYPEYSIRLIMGIIIVLVSYIIFKDTLSRISVQNIEKVILYVGIIFNVISLLLYIIGIYKLGFHLTGNQIQSYGVVIDRNEPRLIGTFSDPNIFSVCNFIFFYYYLTHLKVKWSKLGLFLATTTILLTLSRGAILAILFGILIFFISSKLKTKIKLVIIGLLFIIGTLQFANYFLGINVLDMITSRFESSASDNGSGRLDLWEHGMILFESNPFFGIGLFNFRPYNMSEFGSSLYMHNTFLEVLTESGVIGITLYLSMFILLFISLYKGRLKDSNMTYLFLTLCSMTVLFTSLSMIINEVFFLFVALSWRYLLEAKSNYNK